MGPKKKQPPRNGYYFLMLEYKNQEENRGRYITMMQASEEVKDIWKDMPKEDRDYYNRMADENKCLQKAEKYNTHGVTFTEIDRILNAQENEKKQMDEKIKDTIKHLDRNSTLKTAVFHLMHLNYYCESPADRSFIPAEIGIVKFSLQDGVIDTFHTYVKPGELPLGNRYIAMEHSNSTHKLPLDWDKGVEDLNQLYLSIKNFLKPDGMVGEIPPIYTMPDNINTNASTSAIKVTIQELAINRGVDPELFKIYSLPKLFFELRNACSPNSFVFPTLSIAESELDKDVFNYCRGISCQYHEEEDLMQFCSLATVQRWVYLICDHCCQDLDIDIIPKFHCPMQADVQGHYKRVWKPRKDKDNSNNGRVLQSREQSPSPPPPAVVHKPVKIVDLAELRQPAPLLRGSREAGYPSNSSEVASESKQQPNCWSSVTVRSHQSTLPPALDESNYPSIGGNGRGVNDYSGRYNAWSGRGRGVTRGRGLAANFKQMNLN